MIVEDRAFGLKGRAAGSGLDEKSVGRGERAAALEETIAYLLLFGRQLVVISQIEPSDAVSRSVTEKSPVGLPSFSQVPRAM